MTGKHPAPFTPAIIDRLAELIPTFVPAGHIIHDPFAGEGRRLSDLCRQLGYEFRGTDLEGWAGQVPTVSIGDSTDPLTYPAGPFAVITSPTYNNGVNDHFDPKDSSRRLTYRAALGRELHENNTGRYSGRGSKRGEAAYWDLTAAVVKHWPDICIVNVKDSTRAGETYPLVDLWRQLLEREGYLVLTTDVPCPGYRNGANRDLRADTEALLIANRLTPKKDRP